MQHRSALPDGFELEGYRIERVLGNDGFHIAYLAWDPGAGKPVVIAEYCPGALAVRADDGRLQPRDPVDVFAFGREAFLAEGHTLLAFSHPNVVSLSALFEANRTAYMVLEHVGDHRLSHELSRRGRLDEPTVKSLLAPVLDALDALHAAGVCHLNVTPESIALTTSGPAVSEFAPVLIGFAGAKHALRRHAAQYLPRILAQGYAAPEQYSPTGSQGPWTDIYSAAAVLYRCVTGEAPQEATTRTLMDRMPRAGEAAKGAYSPTLLSGIDEGLALNATARPQTVAEWKWELLASVGPHMAEDTPRRAASVLAVSALLIVASAALVWPRPPALTAPEAHPESETIERLLAEARIHIDSRRYFEPGGNNAVGTLENALALDPENSEAARLQGVIFDALMGQVQVNLNAGRWERAQAVLEQARRLRPDDPGVAAARAAVRAATAPRERIARLLAGAREDLAEGRDVAPPGDNALQGFRAVLDLDPANPAARRGLRRLFSFYAAQTQVALDTGAVDTAEAHLATARRIDPENPELAALTALVNPVAADVVTPAPGQNDGTEGAASSVGTGERAELVGGAAPDPGVGEVGAETAHDDGVRAGRIAELLRIAASDMSADRLTTPEKRNALARYRELQTLAPDHPAIAAGLDQIYERYLVLARSVADTRRDLALRHLDTAESIRPERSEAPALRLKLEPERAQRRLEALAEAAERALTEDRLIVPAEASALEFYRQMRALDPRNPTVTDLGDRIHTALLDFARRLADDDPERGLDHLAAAEDMDHPDNGALGVLGAQYPREAARRIERLWASAEEDLAADRLTTPAERNALARLRTIQAIDPAHPTVVSGLNQIYDRYLILADSVVERRPELARRHLRTAAAIIPERAEAPRQLRALEVPGDGE